MPRNPSSSRTKWSSDKWSFRKWIGKVSTQLSSEYAHPLFWPIFIYFLGAGALSFYQVHGLGRQLEQLALTDQGLDDRYERALYERSKFNHVVRDILELSTKDANAETVAHHFDLHKVAEAQPELMKQDTAEEMKRESEFSGPIAGGIAAPPMMNVNPASTNAPPKPTPAK